MPSHTTAPDSATSACATPPRIRCPIGNITRRRRHVALQRHRDHPHTTGPGRRLGRGLDMDLPAAIGQQHDTLHAHVRQPEQQRHIVDQARGLSYWTVSTTASVQRARAPTPQAETACRARTGSESHYERSSY
jgi:hypothetical protein